MHTILAIRSEPLQCATALKRILPLMFWMLWMPLALPAATFTVTTTNDSGSGSLRQAMTDANSNAGPDVIQFDILGAGAKSIVLQSALPPITDPLVLDGTTQPGFNNKPVIELDGANAGPNASGFFITAGRSTVRGLAINRFKENGIQLQTEGGNVIEGNFIGLDSSGTIDRGNKQRGILITGSASNRIGGMIVSARNIISGNGDSGVAMVDGASWNVVQGNLIGTDVFGSNAIPNGGDAQGVRITGVASTDNLIGGRTPAARNIISGNSLAGVLIDDRASRNLVQGNFIGTDITGTLPIPNGAKGVKVGGASNNTIGGIEPGAGNLIAFNATEGVLINNDAAAASGNAILGNQIFSNGAIGIDLASTAGVTLNDPADADGGANRQQNYPILISATNTVGGLSIHGALNTVANSFGIIIEFFASDACDPSGYGEGQTFLGRTTVSTHANGNAAIAITLPVSVPAGHFLSATATLANNTSEFSPCFPFVQSAPVLALRAAGRGQIALEWPVAAAGFQLESTETLSPPAWTPVVAAIETTNGVNRVITATGNGIRFYRLKK